MLSVQYSTQERTVQADAHRLDMSVSHYTHPNQGVSGVFRPVSRNLGRRIALGPP